MRSDLHQKTAEEHRSAYDDACADTLYDAEFLCNTEWAPFEQCMNDNGADWNRKLDWFFCEEALKFQLEQDAGQALAQILG